MRVEELDIGYRFAFLSKGFPLIYTGFRPKYHSQHPV
jgi:hypothetical protein